MLTPSEDGAEVEEASLFKVEAKLVQGSLGSHDRMRQFKTDTVCY